MFLIERNENNTGVYISGDYEELYFLREAVSALAGERTSYEGYEQVHTVVQKFVFELLHAYRAERDSFKTNCDTPCYKFFMYLPEAIFVADALNDYIMLSESDEYYLDAMQESNSSVTEKIRDRHYIDKAFVRFFQASVWNAVREIIGEAEFEKIEPYRNGEAVCAAGKLRYRGFCRDWVDIMNIRYINDTSGEFLSEVIKKFADRDEEYFSKEKAMNEHFKEGNISFYIDLLDELKYPDENDEEYYGAEFFTNI